MPAGACPERSRRAGMTSFPRKRESRTMRRRNYAHASTKVEATMALFVVRHHHAAERCPAQDPYMGAMLLNHLSRPNVRQHGVEIQGEAIVQGEHTLYL